MVKDSKIMGIISLVWIIMALIWNTAIYMPEGSRIWGFGGVLMLILSIAVLVAERGRAKSTYYEEK